MDNSRAFINYDARFDDPEQDQDPGDGELYGYVYDAETDSHWEIYIDHEGKLYGFPNSALDGTPAHDIAIGIISPQEFTRDEQNGASGKDK